MFLSVWRCAELKTRLHRLKVKVTLLGHVIYPSVCVHSISPESLQRFSLNVTQMLSVRRCAEPMTQLHMSQGAEKFQPPEVGIVPGPPDPKANTLPRSCKSRLPSQGSRSVFYTYPYYIFPCFKLILPRIYSEPLCYSGTFHPDAKTQAVDPTYWPPNVTGCRKT